MASALYTIVDEPVPSRFSQLAVKPLWPVLATMLGGAWVGLPWFAFNGFALGSPTRVRELFIAIAGPIGSVALFAAAHLAIRHFSPGHSELSNAQVSYLILAITIWKLTVVYGLQTLQVRSAALQEHFGGRLRNGALFVILASFASRSILFSGFVETLPDAIYLAIV